MLHKIICSSVATNILSCVQLYRDEKSSFHFNIGSELHFVAATGSENGVANRLVTCVSSLLRKMRKKVLRKMLFSRIPQAVLQYFMHSPHAVPSFLRDIHLPTFNRSIHQRISHTSRSCSPVSRQLSITVIFSSPSRLACLAFFTIYFAFELLPVRVDISTVPPAALVPCHFLA